MSENINKVAGKALPAKSFSQKIKGFILGLKKVFPSGQKFKHLSDKSLIVFEHTGDVIAAEQLLKKAGYEVEVKGPPPTLRTGCDMVVEFLLVKELEVRRLLEKNKLKALKIVPVQDSLLEPVSLYMIKDFGDWLMVRAANMKITVEKENKVIVNISGGGCPDVPFLAAQLVGKNIFEAPEPKTLGQTLCGYSLQLAYEEMVRLCRG